MTYNTIQPPFTLKFWEMSKTELRDYFRWFQDVMPERIRELSQAVKETPGFESWSADFSPRSLDRLGEWFAAHVERRQRTSQETQKIKDRLVFPVEVSDQELTNQTFSIAIDVGMYLAQIFLHNYSTVKWDQPFGSKKDIDYGQPVLAGFGAAPFNPVRMMVTHARALATKARASKDLRNIYEIWSKMVEVN